MNIIHDIPPHQPQGSWVGVDTEIYQLNPKTMHRPTSGKFACLTIAVGDDVYFIDEERKVQEALSRIENAVWIIQKANFDITHLRRWADIPQRKRLWDTMIVDQIIWGGYFDHYALADLVRRHLDMEVDKSMQKYFEKATSMNDLAVEYSCKDAWLLPQIAEAQKKQMRPQDFKVWKDIDMPALWATLDFCGFPIDCDAWLALSEKNKQRATALTDELPFNPNSPKQVKAWMQAHGFPKLKDTQADTLEEAIYKHPDTEAAAMAKKQIECKVYGKRASTYGQKFLDEHVEYQNGYPVIFSEFHINGAETGRFSSSSPNMQNIPVRDTKEFRECFIAPDGYVLIVGDWSAQEPRITGYVTQDERLLEIFGAKKDVYIEMAWDIFGEKITKKDKRRDPMKSTFLGAVYGLSPYGLAKKEGIPKEDAERMLNTFFSIYAGVGRYVDENSKKRNYVETVSGRRIYLNPYSDQCQRNALNAPIQGTAGDMMKMAVAKAHQEWPFDFPFGVCNIVHDEIVALAPDAHAHNVKAFIKKCMEEAGDALCPGIGFKADVAICGRWSEKG